MKPLFVLKLSLAVVAALTSLATARAEDTAKPVKDKALVKALSQYVVVINRPIYVYNWFKATGRSKIWTTQLSADDSVGYEHMMNVAHNYFQAFCTNDVTKDPADCTSEDVTKLFGLGNMFGPGFYASTDPVATSGYGAGSDWVLLQVRLPKGFRLASLMWAAKKDALSKEALAELSDMGCEFSTSTAQGVLNRMLAWGSPGYRSMSGGDVNKCTLSVRRILKERLKIEGLYYSYAATSFEDCADGVALGSSSNSTSGNSLRQGAFVLANPRSIQTNDVKVFNSQTRDATADRIAITTLFYKAANSPGYSSGPANAPALIQYYNNKGVPNFPNYQVRSFAGNGCASFNSTVNQCGDWYSICDKTNINNCTYTLLPVPADLPKVTTVDTPQKISSSTVPSTMSSAHNGQLLWTDLDGKDQTPKVGTWIRNSLLGCSDIAPYGYVPTVRKNHFYPKSKLDQKEEDTPTADAQ